MKKALAVFVVMAVLAAFADNPHITRLIELTDVLISSPADGDVLTYDAGSGKWQNKQPSTAVKTRFQIVNSTSNSSQTVFTSSETSMYLVSVYGEEGVVTTSGPILSLSWTDDFGTSSVDGIQVGGNSGAHTSSQQFSIPIRIPAGNNLNLVVSGADGSVTYSLYIIVEKL